MIDAEPTDTEPTDTGPVDLVAEIQHLVTDYAAEHHCPSVAYGVVLDGLLTITGSFRSELVDEATVPATVDAGTVYRIASMTKSFSAALTLLLRDEGVFGLDDPVAAHARELAGLRGPTADAPAVRIRDLLSMRAGFVTDDTWADRHLDLTDAEFDAVVAGGVVFGEPTGVAYEYSNFGFAVLGRVIHRATGVRLQQLVSERLLAPLGLHDTTWVMPGHDRWARPLEWYDGAFHAELPPLGDGLIAPMGGLWTTVADIARWVTWLDDAFPPRDDEDAGPLCRASRREMQTEQCYTGMRTLRGVRSPTSYGYGLRVLDEAHRVVTHSGGLPGYGSNMRWLSGRRTGAIAFANTTYAPMTELTALILDAVVASGVVTPAPRPLRPAVAAAATRLVALLNAWDDDAADDLFTDNVAPDESYARRRAGIAPLLPLEVTSVTADNDASATIHVVGSDDSTATIDFVLALHSPTRIQAFELSR